MMQLYYILDGKEPVPVASMIEWVKWFEKADRRVALTELDSGEEVSTVFLSLDHRFIGDGPPVLFETLVRGGNFDGVVERYCTWDEAEAGHKRMVELVMSGLIDQ
jgi:hypothetical protein